MAKASASSSTMVPSFTSPSDFGAIVSRLRSSFFTGKTKHIEFRVTQLRNLMRLLVENRQLLVDALHQDLKRPLTEALLTEIDYTHEHVLDLVHNIHRWAAEEKVNTPMIFRLDSCSVRKEPLGVVLVIGPWNYPIQLLLIPVAAAIAAGNCVLIKPSEVSEVTSRVLARLLPQYLDSQCFFPILGGSTSVGKIIMTAAANHLTPVTLELGGKSPIVIGNEDGMDWRAVAHRIVHGKYQNAGQTCIAPDFIVCQSKSANFLIAALTDAIKEFYGPEPKFCKDYSRIINIRHLRRLERLLPSSSSSAQVVCGGVVDPEDLYVSPTIVQGVAHDDPLMSEEIFGPILPLLIVESIEEQLTFLQRMDSPLVIYCFSNQDKFISRVMESTRSGSFVVNDTIMQASVPDLPFGGVGHSGFGRYHGKASFDCFSNLRSVMKRSLRDEYLQSFRYPPYSQQKTSWLEWILYSIPRFPYRD